MLLRTDKEATFQEPDGETIEKVIRGLLEDPDESFVILCESEEHNNFMQTCPTGPSTFFVESHMGLGTEAKHYQIENVSTESVITLFQSFNAGDASWKNDHHWIDVTSEMARPAGDSWKQFI